VDGFIYGHLAVHRIPWNTEYYSITHIPSGFRMPKDIGSCKHAKLIAEKIHEYPHINFDDLRELPKKEFKKLGDLFFESVKEIDNE